ncbi:HYC_CC_PP family protein [Solitalea koreensis]|uniref:Uncharacterized protein n=1 Tax=Solitalea koreensis TaxID=543615 RepID=A0A521DB59_9SPHI|nr:hypothetical protein [Solitalea koreensis]SMO68875.1 hypothetical protein SAMN06265350_106156 [Solitalea koreensis]
MMRKHKQIWAVLLSLLIIISGTGFSLSVHICCGKIQHFSLFAKAKDCGMMDIKSMSAEKSASSAIVIKKFCCEDKTFSIEAREFKAEPKAQAPPIDYKLLNTFVYVFSFVKYHFPESSSNHALLVTCEKYHSTYSTSAAYLQVFRI